MTLVDTDARKQITRSFDATLFVEAGAGTGKTHSLVARISAMISAGLPPEASATSPPSPSPRTRPQSCATACEKP